MMSSAQLQYNLESFGHAFRGVIQAATIDNVQKSAVTAMNTLGSIITVDPPLIGKAVDALGGTSHVGMALFKRQYGIESGGVAFAIRHSAPATRCFLLITGLKLYLTNEEVAEVLYHTMSKASMLEKAPVSQAQLVSLVAKIEPHAKLLLSQELISSPIVGPVTEYLSKIEPNSPTSRNGSQLFEVLPADKLALVLLGVFVSKRKEETASIELYGRVSGIWLASLFAWLLPHSTCVALNETPICGQGPNNDRFIFINLDIIIFPLEQWHCKEFQSAAHLQSIFWDQGKMPLVVAKALLPRPLSWVGGVFIDHMAPKMIGIAGDTVQEKKTSFLPWK